MFHVPLKYQLSSTPLPIPSPPLAPLWWNQKLREKYLKFLPSSRCVTVLAKMASSSLIYVQGKRFSLFTTIATFRAKWTTSNQWSVSVFEQNFTSWQEMFHLLYTRQMCTKITWQSLMASPSGKYEASFDREAISQTWFTLYWFKEIFRHCARAKASA